MSFVQRIRQPKLLSVLLLSVTLVIGIVIGTVIDTGVRAQKQTSSVAPDATPLTVPQAVPITNDFAKLAKRLEPSVVYIESDYLPKPGKRRKSNPNDGSNDNEPGGQDPSDMLKRFFGQEQNGGRAFRQEGSGTGFIVDRNGYIITNQHVVKDADRVKVKLNGDETDYRAKVIGIDPLTDLAVIKIEAHKQLTPVQVGNSDSVSVGDWAIAIGSPFGLQATVTAGIVSATSRDLPGTEAFQHFLQTDAAINPGNSGGPLLNIRGEVIGINTMIATRSGSYEGIGFALPSNVAVHVYNEIIHKGRVVRGSIGVEWTRSGSQSDTLQALGVDHGVLVESAPTEGPAGGAGVKADDIIVALNDHPVKNGEELIAKVADLPIGSTALLTVNRSGKQMDFKVNIQERAVVWKDRPEYAATTPQTSPKGQLEAKFGITITRLTERERQNLGIEDKTGVKVLSVDPGSFADDIGIIEGDVVLAINRTTLALPADMVKAEEALKAGQAVAMHVLRSLPGGEKHPQTKRIYLSGRLSSNP